MVAKLHTPEAVQEQSTPLFCEECGRPIPRRAGGWYIDESNHPRPGRQTIGDESDDPNPISDDVEDGTFCSRGCAEANAEKYARFKADMPYEDANQTQQQYREEAAESHRELEKYYTCDNPECHQSDHEFTISDAHTTTFPYDDQELAKKHPQGETYYYCSPECKAFMDAEDESTGRKAMTLESDPEQDDYHQYLQWCRHNGKTPQNQDTYDEFLASKGRSKDGKSEPYGFPDNDYTEGTDDYARYEQWCQNHEIPPSDEAYAQWQALPEAQKGRWTGSNQYTASQGDVLMNQDYNDPDWNDQTYGENQEVENDVAGVGRGQLQSRDWRRRVDATGNDHQQEAVDQHEADLAQGLRSRRAQGQKAMDQRCEACGESFVSGEACPSCGKASPAHSEWRKGVMPAMSALNDNEGGSLVPMPGRRKAMKIGDNIGGSNIGMPRRSSGKAGPMDDGMGGPPPGSPPPMPKPGPLDDPIAQGSRPSPPAPGEGKPEKHGAQLLRQFHSDLISLIDKFEPDMMLLENDKVDGKLGTVFDDLASTVDGMADLFSAEYPDLPKLAKIAKPDKPAKPKPKEDGEKKPPVDDGKPDSKTEAEDKGKPPDGKPDEGKSESGQNLRTRVTHDGKSQTRMLLEDSLKRAVTRTRKAEIQRSLDELGQMETAAKKSAQAQSVAAPTPTPSPSPIAVGENLSQRDRAALAALERDIARKERMLGLRPLY